MYESFFGFTERPFALTPNTKYLYLSEHHESVIRMLLYGIEQRVGFMMLSGEVGSGKTTTVRALLNLIEDSVETSVILNPLLSTRDLVTNIARDFGISVASDSTQVQIDALNNYLLDINAKGKTAVVIIDEAQNLSFEAFEMSRMLSNLETESQKLLNIIFVGQPELVKIISHKRLRQLAQRIQVHAQLHSLSLAQTQAYIAHRLQSANPNETAHFDGYAVQQIYKKSKGIPRIINAICDMGLLAAFSKSSRTIDRKIIKQALKEVPQYVYHS